MKTVDSLLERAKTLKTPAVISVAAAQDEHVLEAVEKASQLGVAKFILCGDTEKIKTISQKLGLKEEHQLLHADDPAEAVAIAVSQVTEGRAAALMKGLVDTSVIMKQALQREAGFRTDRKLSHLAVFEVAAYHKLLFVTDAALNIAPDLETKKHIIQNAVDAVVKLGIERPKAALLCAKEKVDEKMPVTLEYAELVKMNRAGEFAPAFIDGPFALDNAVSAESAKIKGINSEAAGDADILVCPDIEAANILYKSLAFLAGARNGGVILGAKAPIILTSRADSSDSKLLAIALGALFQ